jgi:hypothetical protein
LTTFCNAFFAFFVMLTSEQLRSLISTRGVDTGESVILREKRERLFVQHIKSSPSRQVNKRNRGKTPGGRTLLQSYLEHGIDANPADTAFTILQKSLAGAGVINKGKLIQQQTTQLQKSILPLPLSPLNHGLAGISVLKSLAPSIAGAMYHTSFTLLDRDRDGFLTDGDVEECILELRVPFIEEAQYLDQYARAASQSGAAIGVDFPSFVRICRRDMSLRLTHMASWLSQHGPRQALAAAAALSKEQQAILETEAKASEARRHSRLKNKLIREFSSGLSDQEEDDLLASERMSYEPPPRFAVPLEVNNYKGIAGMFIQKTMRETSSTESKKAFSYSPTTSNEMTSSSSISTFASASPSISSSSLKFRAETPIPLPPLLTSGRVGTALSQSEDDSEIEAILRKPWQRKSNEELPFVYGPSPPAVLTHFSRHSPSITLPSSSSSHSFIKNKIKKRRKFDINLVESRKFDINLVESKTSTTLLENDTKMLSQVNTSLLDQHDIKKVVLEDGEESNTNDIENNTILAPNDIENNILAPVVIHSLLDESDKTFFNQQHLSSLSSPSYTLDSFRASSVGFGSHSVMTSSDEQIRPSSLPSPSQAGGLSFIDFSERKFGLKNARLAHALLNGLPPAKEILFPHRARSESPPSALKRVSRDGTPRSRSNSRLRVGFNVDSNGRPSTTEEVVEAVLISNTTQNDSMDYSINNFPETFEKSNSTQSGDYIILNNDSTLTETETNNETNNDSIESMFSISAPSLPKTTTLSWNFEDIQKPLDSINDDNTSFSIPSVSAIAINASPKYDMSILGRYEGAKRMCKVLRRIVRRRLRPRFDLWVKVVIDMMRIDYASAATTIQALVRGHICRSRLTT